MTWIFTTKEQLSCLPDDDDGFKVSNDTLLQFRSGL